MIKNLLIGIMALTLFGCSTSYESVNQINDSAFLQLGGNFLNTQLIVDNQPGFDLTEESIETFKLNGQMVARFPIATGKHQIKIIKAGVVIVNRVIFVSNSNTFEVVIP